MLFVTSEFSDLVKIGGLAPAYMAWRGLTTPSLFTVHNLMYAGMCANALSARIGCTAHYCRYKS